MKKLLLLILITLLLVLTIFTVVNGVDFGNVNILGFVQIKEKNEQLDTKIEQATRLASVDYPKKISELNTNVKNMNEEKTTYEDMVSVSTEDEIKQATQFGNYTLEYLFAEIGTHQKREGVGLDLKILTGNGADKTYNLDFTVTGSYVGISEFLIDIEDDSTLGFKIENFRMIPGNSTTDLRATFLCRNIKIEGISRSTQVTNTDNNTTNSNTTNNTNTTNNSNTTNNTEDTENTNNSNTTNDTNNTNSAQ